MVASILSAFSLFNIRTCTNKRTLISQVNTFIIRRHQSRLAQRSAIVQNKKKQCRLSKQTNHPFDLILFMRLIIDCMNNWLTFLSYCHQTFQTFKVHSANPTTAYTASHYFPFPLHPAAIFSHPFSHSPPTPFTDKTHLFPLLRVRFH